MTAQLNVSHGMRELDAAQMEQIGGGLLPLIPLAIAFGKGFAVGAGVAGGVLVVADAIGLVEI